MALQGSVSDIRKQFADLFAAISPGYPCASDAVSVSDGIVQGVRYRVYTPKPIKEKIPLPLGVFTHGGGFILGDLDAEDVLCRAFCEKANTVLVSVDYRLAPEHEHPTQLKDTMTVIEWVRLKYTGKASYGSLTESSRHIPTHRLLALIQIGSTPSAPRPARRLPC